MPAVAVHAVSLSVDTAVGAAQQAGEAQVQARRDRLADYLDRTRATIEAFRTDVPTVQADGAYDVSRSRTELAAADEAGRQLVATSTGLACRLSETLESSAAYLDAFAAALAAVEAGEPQAQPELFLDRYQRLVESYNQWATLSTEAVARLDQDLEGSLTLPEGSEPSRALLRSAWPRSLLDACEDARTPREGGGPPPLRVASLDEQLALALVGSKPSAGACLDAATPMLQAYLACVQGAGHQDGRATSDADGPATLEKALLGAIDTFEAAVGDACLALDEDENGLLDGSGL